MSFGGQFLWVFTAIAALGVLLYLYAFTGHTTEAEDARECESQIKGTNTGINDWVSFTKLFFVIASRSTFVLRIIDFYTDFIHYCYQWRSRCIELGTYYVLCHGGCPHLYGWCIIR